jgi:hypothetical protein
MVRATMGTTTTKELNWDVKEGRFRWRDGGRPLGVGHQTADT